MGKFSTARWVCAWYLAFFGTRTSPMVSCSMRYSMSTAAVGDVAVVDVVVVVAALGRNSPLCSAMPVTLAGRIAAGPAEAGPIPSHLTRCPTRGLSPVGLVVTCTDARGEPCNHGGVANRRPKTLRDMVLSMGLLAVVALVLFGMYGGVSFSPGRATEGQAPTADVTGGLNGRPRWSGFPVVIPDGLPATWNPSSFSFTDKSAATTQQPPAVRAG